MKNLSIGIQEFSELREFNCIYVDKTELIHEIIKGKYYFLSRPRRFGKSLLITTLKELFKGNKELFEDCWIYEKIEWKTFPIIHIDFTRMDYQENGLQEALKLYLKKIAQDYDIELNTKTCKEKFMELIEKLAKKQGKVVILIDEYDKPITEYLDRIEIAEHNKAILKNFYSCIKGEDENLRFVFLTGVSKFSQVSIFSDLNNLEDITQSKVFCNLLGYTQEELNSYFKEYIKKLEVEIDLDNESLLKKIKEMYNGYSWTGNERLYNPFSILNLFKSLQFKRYWFKTGTPTFLIKMIRKYKIDLENLDHLEVREHFFDKFEIGNLDVYTLLFQTGYLTVKEYNPKRGGRYKLGYPNKEVEEAFLFNLLESYSFRTATSSNEIFINIED